MRAAGLMHLILLCLLSAGCNLVRPDVPTEVPVHEVEASQGILYAGAAAVEITPESRVYMGGYGMARRSEGVHDPLFARALVLQRGDARLALVAVDLIGLQYEDVRWVQEDMTGIDPRHVVVASTHTHSGPDTIGIWGIPPFWSGVDEDYLKRVKRGILDALRKAQEALEPAELASGSVLAEPSGLLQNLRRPGVVDPEIVVLHVRGAGGGASLATVVELGCHPEVLGRWNTRISADFPHWTVARLEAALGGVAFYVSGALGGLVTPDVPRRKPPDPAAEWSEAARIGQRLAEHALSVVRTLTDYERQPALALWHAPLYLRNDNLYYDLVRWTGVLERTIFKGGYARTEVNLWQVGALRVATVPGEITPDLGMRIKREVGGRPTMLVGLANDELGYLLPEADYDLPLYEYERTLSPGRDSGERVARRLADLGLLAGRAWSPSPPGGGDRPGLRGSEPHGRGNRPSGPWKNEHVTEGSRQSSDTL